MIGKKISMDLSCKTLLILTPHHHLFLSRVQAFCCNCLVTASPVYFTCCFRVSKGSRWYAVANTENIFHIFSTFPGKRERRRKRKKKRILFFFNLCLQKIQIWYISNGISWSTTLPFRPLSFRRGATAHEDDSGKSRDVQSKKKILLQWRSMEANKLSRYFLHTSSWVHIKAIQKSFDYPICASVGILIIFKPANQGAHTVNESVTASVCVCECVCTVSVGEHLPCCILSSRMLLLHTLFFKISFS